MNCSRIFKLSAVATLVMASYSASANLYNVEVVTVPDDLGLESYGSAIDESGNVAGDTKTGKDAVGGFQYQCVAVTHPVSIDYCYFVST